jgi:predicted ester cyclase
MTTNAAIAPPPDLVQAAAEWFRRVDAQDISKVLELTTPDLSFCMGSQKLGRDGYAGMNAMFFSAFPDGRHINDELVAIGTNRVLAKGRFIGTHSGAPFQGIPAAGKKISLAYLCLATFTADGKIRSADVQVDSAGLMQQLAA